MRTYFRGNPLSGALIWQAFSANNYVVFIPDFDFRVGAPMRGIAASLSPAIDKIVQMEIADRSRLGVYGRSHGGYSTYSVIVQTDRFKAALAAVGYSNEFTAYDIVVNDGSGFMISLLENEDLGATPWQDPRLYIENSPYFYFDRVTTPVLIQYGEKENVFPITSREAFLALRRLGKTVTLLGYPDEGHGVSKPENQIDFTNRALDWFDQYLRPDHKPPAN